MKVIKVEGIVVGEQSYSETSKILKIFTRELGIISVLSKGCKKTKSPFREASTKLIYANFDISYKNKNCVYSNSCFLIIFLQLYKV